MEDSNLIRYEISPNRTSNQCFDRYLCTYPKIYEEQYHNIRLKILHLFWVDLRYVLDARK